MAKSWEGPETEEWWWGGKSKVYDRIVERDPDDDNIYEPNNF